MILIIINMCCRAIVNSSCISGVQQLLTSIHSKARTLGIEIGVRLHNVREKERIRQSFGCTAYNPPCGPPHALVLPFKRQGFIRTLFYRMDYSKARTTRISTRNPNAQYAVWTYSPLLLRAMTSCSLSSHGSISTKRGREKRLLGTSAAKLRKANRKRWAPQSIMDKVGQSESFGIRPCRNQ
jgi:hypothetical protein